MGDWIGFAFLILLALGAFFGLRALSKPRVSTSDEFERNAAQNTTMVGALMNALHDVTDPGAERAKEVRMQMKDGRYQKKQREGKAEGEDEADIEER
ncbi:MAG TPA: hypothetical protein VGO43_08735 [Pyrinomonadaceae bacterium]|jgi:hypothetical protein|nr:hypothetical protein [Pyrinomonadaceae bacterium]